MQRYHSNESVVGAVASNWRGSEDSKVAYRLGGGRVRMSFQSRPSEESGSLTTFPKSERQCSVVVIIGGKGKGKGKANWFAL